MSPEQSPSAASCEAISEASWAAGAGAVRRNLFAIAEARSPICCAGREPYVGPPVADDYAAPASDTVPDYDPQPQGREPRRPRQGPLD